MAPVPPKTSRPARSVAAPLPTLPSPHHPHALLGWSVSQFGWGRAVVCCTLPAGSGANVPPSLPSPSTTPSPAAVSHARSAGTPHPSLCVGYTVCLALWDRG